MTTPFDSVAKLSEQELLDHFTGLVVRDRQTTSELLVAIAEIDERKLWARHACSSMFIFCSRSRDDHRWSPPPQIPASGIIAPGSCLG
ncbi:MAG: hypothetical protein ABR538_12255 [Candidatus Binatia bacterium]